MLLMQLKGFKTKSPVKLLATRLQACAFIVFLSLSTLLLAPPLSMAQALPVRTCEALFPSYPTIDHQGFKASDLLHQYVPGKLGKISYWQNKLGRMTFDNEQLKVLRLGQLQLVLRQKENRVVWEFYVVSNRGMGEVKGYYPRSFIEPKQFANKTVLDLGTGKGQFVEDLKALSQSESLNIRVFGSDINLNEKQKNDPSFIQSDSLTLPFKDGEVDLVFSTWSVFRYEQSTNPKLLVGILRELVRIVKPGGMIRISPIDGKIMQKLVNEVNELEIVTLGRIIPKQLDSKTFIPWGHYIEIRRK